jgi:hypothetical protein
MLLYHGTNGAWLGNILRRGLEPRHGKPGRNNWTHVPHQSNARCVYLTNSYAPYFAFNAAQGDPGYCAVVEIDTDRLDTDNLYPDEDFLEQASRNSRVDGMPPGLNMSGRTLWFRKRQFDYGADWGYRDPDTKLPTTWWEASLKFLGTCCHRGTIPASAITRAVSWPDKPNIGLHFVWDPTITILNQRIVGAQYQALTAKLFGDETPRFEPVTVVATGEQIENFDQRAVDAFDPAGIADLRRFP